MNALSLFSGALGLDLGVAQSGFNFLSYGDIDKDCRDTIKQNHPGALVYGDIYELTAEQILSDIGHAELDLVTGGPPCQSFSTAGKRKGLADPRGDCIIKYTELCLNLRPKFFVIENVRGLLSAKDSHGRKGGALYQVTELIRSGGYEFSFNLYNAANYGSYQKRERVVVICSREGPAPPYLIPTHGEAQWRTVRQALNGLNSCTALSFAPARLKYYKMLGPGQNWRDLPVDIQKEAMGKSYNSGGGKTGFYRRLGWDSPAPTLVTHPAMPATSLAHPEENRPLSVEEYKRLQGFPDSWQVSGTLLSQYKQLGNAVPVELGRAIGDLIRKLIDGEAIPIAPGDVSYSRYKDTDHTNFLKKFKPAGAV